MTTPDTTRDWQPRFPLLIAITIFVVAALSLCWPMLTGQYIGGDDQVTAGFAFRQFAAEHFKLYGEIPQWNPYIFGGMPFSAVIGHGDVFYPTAWFRWFVEVDFGMSFGFFFHIALAGLSLYALARGFGLSWTAAVVGGVAYQLSGNVASMLNNGHDGKLFVAALAPFAFLALLRAIRHGKWGHYGLFALVVGLIILTPHVQMAYYVLVACGLFTLWLAFLDPERRPDQNPWLTLAMAFGAVVLGVGISAIQIYPIMSHVKYTPRAVAGPSTGWEYATSYAFPPRELMTLILPQFNGMDRGYIGGNPVKSHTEYLGAITLTLAILGMGVARQRRILLPFAVIGGLFALVSFGGHTPFYRLWYSVMPMMDKVRAAGMAFALVGLCLALLAGMGVDRVLRREVKGTTLYTILGVFAGIAVLGVAGILQPISAALAHPARGPAIVLNAPELQMGSMRLLIFVALGGAALVMILRGRLHGVLAAAALTLVVGLDSWSILKHFAPWIPPADVTYADDQITARIKQDATMPFRTYQPTGETEFGRWGVYQGSELMARHVPTLFGYHGMESVYFDSLFGTKNVWTQQVNPRLWDLYAVDWFLLNQDLQDSIPGFDRVAGPVPTPHSRSGQAVLFERRGRAPWVRVVPRGVKVPHEQLVSTLVDADFPADEFVLFADTAVVAGTTDNFERPGPATIHAHLTDWRPGAMTVQLDGQDSVTNWLLVAENWYPDWHATVDGQPAPAVRANHAMLGVAIPPGAKEISLVFDVKEYRQGKIVTFLCAAIALAILGMGTLRRRTADV